MVGLVGVDLTWLAFTVLTALAAAYDVLTIAWHRAREAGKVGRTVTIGCAMEAIGALPFVAVVVSGEWWPLVAGVIGSAIGTALGMRHAAPAR